MLLRGVSIPSVFKRIYYARVNDFIIKPFCPEEFLFHVFRLCKVLLGSKFELNLWQKLPVYKKIWFDKKESELLEILCKNSPQVVTYDEIDHHLYKNETLSQDHIRSLVREIRAKIPTICLKTVRGTGYKVEWGGLVKFISCLKLNFYTFGSNLLKFAKTLALFSYFNFNDFHSTFDKFACLFLYFK